MSRWRRRSLLPAVLAVSVGLAGCVTTIALDRAVVVRLQEAGSGSITRSFCIRKVNDCAASDSKAWQFADPLADSSLEGELMLSFRRRLLAVLIVGGMPLPGRGMPEWVEMPLPAAQAVIRQLVAQPGQFVELCTRLKQGRGLTWQFDAEGPVEFNTHFHAAEEVRYPERMSALSAAKGSLMARSDQDYCWMWTNLTAEPLTIRVRLSP